MLENTQADIKDELSQELNRYYFLIKTFEKVINAIEFQLKGSNHWFIFCHKIGRKFHTHITSFVYNVTQDLTKIQIDDIHVSNRLDISVLYTNLRLQFDTYSTFHHIFIHEGDWSEKIVRFRLWQLDSLIERQKFNYNRNPEILEQVQAEQKEMREIFSVIEGMDFFKNLTQTEKGRLLKETDKKFEYANWKFDKSLLHGKKAKYSWKDMALNTGMKPDIYSDMHQFASMHVHANYVSILQNDQLTQDQVHAFRMVALRLACYLTCLYMDDLCGRFSSAKDVAQLLQDNEAEIVRSFLKTGRETTQIKYFK